MSLVPEERTPLTDEALRLIGVIAVESARLEWFLAGLLSMLDPGRNHMQALKTAHGRAANQIVAALVGRPSWMGEAATAGLGRWATNSSSLLGRRGVLMHSTLIVGEMPEAPPRFSHLSSRLRTPIDLDDLGSFGLEVAAHAALGPHMWFMAMDPMRMALDEDQTP